LKLKEFPEQKDYPEADALILSEKHEVTIKINSDYDYETNEKVHIVIKLLKNIENHSSVELSVLNGDKISEINARTIKPDGSEVTLQSDDFHTIIGGGYYNTFYSDKKTIKFTFPAVEKNCLIEYEYTIDETYPSCEDEWYIQGELPKLQNIYTLTVPIVTLNKEKSNYGLGVKYKANNCSIKTPDILRNNDSLNIQNLKSTTFTWEQKDIPAFEPDPMMPPRSNYVQYVELAPSKWRQWNDFSDWYYNHQYKSKLIITDEITNKAIELTKTCTNEIDKIKSIYKFIQNMRYIEIALGKSGRIPATPMEVLNHNYGDCKDKSTLLVALLRSIGITSKPVLVLTSDKGRIDKKFPTGKFNHMITKVLTKDGKVFWIDATIEHCRLGELPSMDKDIDVLVLNEDGTSQVENIPGCTFTDNVKDIDMKINLLNPDSTILNISTKYNGEFDIDYRYRLNEKTKIELEKYCKSLVSDNYLNAKVIDCTINGIESTDNNLGLNFKLNVPNAIEKQGEYIFLNIDPFQLPGDWGWLGRDKRKYDIDFDYPFTINKTIEVILPENQFNIRNLPQNSLDEESNLYYSKNYEIVSNNKLIIKERFSVKSKIISASDFLKVRKFIDKVKSKQNEKIILTSR
jgi:hypothetical protein